MSITIVADDLDSVHQFQIIFFNHQVRAWDLTGGQNRVAFGTARNKEVAAAWVAGITADGGTDRVAALSRAIAFRSDVIFFLTDDDTPMSAADLYRSSLSTPKIGSLLRQKRFQSSQYTDRIQAKTGYVRHVYALSGYCKNTSDQWLAFAILVNGNQPSPKSTMDQIVTIIMNQ